MFHMQMYNICVLKLILNPNYYRTVVPTPEYCQVVKGIQVIQATLATQLFFFFSLYKSMNQIWSFPKAILLLL